MFENLSILSFFLAIEFIGLCYSSIFKDFCNFWIYTLAIQNHHMICFQKENYSLNCHICMGKKCNYLATPTNILWNSKEIVSATNGRSFALKYFWWACEIDRCFVWRSQIFYYFDEKNC